jgi:hypothetical protein
MRKIKITLLLMPLLALLSFRAGDPVKKSILSRLEDPAVLAKVLNDDKQPDPVVMNVGSLRTLIRSAVPAGPAATDEGFLNFKSQIMTYGKTQPIVIYCGCCALEHCPNIGPALDYALDQGYKNVKVLNIEKRLKTEWEDKGYPMK